MSDIATDLADINHLLAEYCLASDEGRVEDWARLFAKDGEMHAFRRVWKGFDELVSFLSAAPEGIHIGGLPRIDLDADRAEATMNFAFINHEKVVWSMGHYIDELARTTDGWRIQSRKVKILKPSKTE